MDGRAREWLDAGSFFQWAPGEPPRQTSELRIFHAEFGDPEAPTLLLLHGFPTSSIDWYDVVESLSRDRRVCVLDFPGFGFSDKPQGDSYTLARDAELVGHYVGEVLGVADGAVVAHDRGDSVALAFLARCAAGETPFDLTDLTLTNGNMFLPLSNLNEFQRIMLDADRAAQVVDSATPELLAAGMGENTFTPARSLEDPAIAALAATFAFNDGLAVIHDTIQYLVERSENERDWLESLAASSVPTTLAWGLYDTVSPLRAAAYIWDTYLSAKPGRNEFWLLPLANHYLQHDQPAELVEVITAALSQSSPELPGPAHDRPGAAILLDRSRKQLPSAKEVLRA
jgi:pimeloyl-ACP methyl ester carboxylesterase